MSRHPDLGVVIAVIVTYFPDETYPVAFDAIVSQVDHVVIVDNGSGAGTQTMLKSLQKSTPKRISLILNDENKGLGEAQNQGILASLDAGADWVLLLDQDSIAGPGMVASMAQAWENGLRSHGNVAFIGPRLKFGETGIQSPYLMANHRWSPLPVHLTDEVLLPVLFVIASGSLIRAKVLRDAGLMRADFFIDYIDIEYGMRMNEKGFCIAVVPWAELTVWIGDPSPKTVAGRVFLMTNHSALRRYTIFYNRIRLWKSRGRRWPGWLLFDIVAAIVDVLRILFAEQQKATKLGAVLRGAWNGFLRQSN